MCVLGIDPTCEVRNLFGRTSFLIGGLKYLFGGVGFTRSAFASNRLKALSRRRKNSRKALIFAQIKHTIQIVSIFYVATPTHISRISGDSAKQDDIGGTMSTDSVEETAADEPRIDFRPARKNITIGISCSTGG